MKILVTGADGMLGKDLCPLLESHDYEVVKTDIYTLDITDKQKVLDFVQETDPDLIIHGAAYTAVDKAETEKEKALAVNEEGTRNLAQAASSVNANILYISTDYVFNGLKNTPYTPEDTPSPINVYGISKLKGEQAIQGYTEDFWIVRTSWLYGANGKNFVDTIISFAQQKPKLKVVSDQIGCPTWTIALSRAIIKILKEVKPFGIYHVCGGGQTSWYEFAKKILELAKINTPIEPIESTEFPQLAKRPRYSVMDNEGFCPDWQVSLKEYISSKKELS